MELEKEKIVVLMGGISSEREISLVSGGAVLRSLRRDGIKAYEVDIKSADESLLEEKLRDESPSAAFIALHGKYGEDGGIQALLEKLSVPYTGSGVLSSAVCFNKYLCKQVLGSFSVPIPSYSLLSRGRGSSGPDFPVVVKPASGGSAIGITLAGGRAELELGLETAFAEDENVLVEEYIEGRELTVSILGNLGTQVFPITEIETDEPFYNYKAKYIPGMSRHILPAELDANQKRTVENTARKVYRVLGCRGFARIDIILSKQNVPYVLDVNTIPGLTPTSLFPESARAAGMEMNRLCRKLLELAMEAG